MFNVGCVFGTRGFRRCDGGGGEAAELGRGEAEMVNCFGVGGFVDWAAGRKCGLAGEIGADDFLRKPFDVAKLKKTIKVLLKIKEQIKE